jgi:hypothetical protein
MDDQLKHKTGAARDLEPQFDEILEELVQSVCSLHLADSVTVDLNTYGPEIQKTKQRLLDVISNTLIMDPH